MSDKLNRPRPSLGGDRPDPHRPRLWVETWSPQNRRPVELVVLNDWLMGFHVHFLAGGEPTKDRTRPCSSLTGECPWCPTVKNRTWKAYLGVHRLGSQRPSILEVTLGCWESTPDLRYHDGSLRGTTWRFYRQQDSCRSRLLAEKTLSLVKTPRFTKVDVLSVLARMWCTDFESLTRLAGSREGEGGWGHPAHTDAPNPTPAANAVAGDQPTGKLSSADAKSFTARLKQKGSQKKQ